MLADKWLLLFGIPVIGLLLVQTVRRIAKLKTHIDQVRDEQARNPLPPFAQLSMLMQEQTEERTRGKRPH